MDVRHFESAWHLKCNTDGLMKKHFKALWGSKLKLILAGLLVAAVFVVRIYSTLDGTSSCRSIEHSIQGTPIDRCLIVRVQANTQISFSVIHQPVALDQQGYSSFF